MVILREGPRRKIDVGGVRHPALAAIARAGLKTAATYGEPWLRYGFGWGGG